MIQTKNEQKSTPRLGKNYKKERKGETIHKDIVPEDGRVKKLKLYIQTNLLVGFFKKNFNFFFFVRKTRIFGENVRDG